MENLVGSAKLQLGVPDTILFKDGAPQAWLFTSKTGDVMKKRSLRKTSIRDRFTRLSTSNPNNPQQRLATVRFMDGTVRNLGRDPFKEMMAKFPATEPGIMSIQCYVQGKGNAGTTYRNSYKVANDKGLVITGTSSFTTIATAEQRESPLSTWSQREIKLAKCNASSITTALDAVTLSIVRYLESQQDRPTRVLHLQNDYVVDSAGQIWLTWISETTIAVADAAQDLRLANVAVEGPRGRGEFLGAETALAMQRDFGGPPSPVRKPRRRAGAQSAGETNGSNITSLLTEEITKGIDQAAELIELPRGTVGGGGAGGIADMFSRAEVAKNRAKAGSGAGAVEQSSMVDNPSTLSSSVALVDRADKGGGVVNASLSTMTVGVRAGEAWESDGRAAQGTDMHVKHFPSSFACAGDYCAIRVLVRGGERGGGLFPVRLVFALFFCQMRCHAS